MVSTPMTSSRPYFVRAIYEWIVDNGLTPHLAVYAPMPGVQVPTGYANKDGQIILNIAPSAVTGLLMSNQAIQFSARFGGVPTSIEVPLYALMGIYARENGQGMMFEIETPPVPPAPSEPEPLKTEKKVGLRVVK